jgi:hypothetical protein
VALDEPAERRRVLGHEEEADSAEREEDGQFGDAE